MIEQREISYYFIFVEPTVLQRTDNLLGGFTTDWEKRYEE